MKHELAAGHPCAMGAHHDGDGVNFAVFSENAASIELCLFSQDDGAETARIALPERTGPVWHGYLKGLAPGALYGYRAHGTYAPEAGHRFNPNKLLLDPYAREYAGGFADSDVLFGYDPNSPDQDLSFDTRDSAPFVPKCIVQPQQGERQPERHMAARWDDVLIYEAHVKGLTKLHPGVPPEQRGTYEGVASDAMIEHLTSLGVTAVELLPVHAFVDDAFLLKRRLRNYWGYNSIGFFVPEPRYRGPAGRAGFRAMVDRLHGAGIEVILDVVYNHTAEGDHLGPTMSFRGLDNASYYRLNAGQQRLYVNDTGTGNTLNMSHPYVLAMVMDSLRYWVTEMGVDGFRFDLATTLAREGHGFDPHGGFLDAIRQEPVLSKVRMIAEPWDIGPGGYQLGAFPHDFGEWNDGFRDTVRRFWRGDAHAAQELGSRLLGSANPFDRKGRRPWASINFLAAHDGFTLADVTRYDKKHNEANGEGNRDGHHSNFSDNCGIEGETDDEQVLARRARRVRNLLTTLFLSQGTPMLLAGDEIGHSQRGNNNAYCQDNETSWIDWESADADLLAFVRSLSGFRKAHKVLRQSRFLHGLTRQEDGKPDVEWREFDGEPLNWRDPGLASLCLLVRGSAEAPDYEHTQDAVFIAINGEYDAQTLRLPDAPDGWSWRRGLDSSGPENGYGQADGHGEGVASRSVAAFVLEAG